MTNSRQQAKDGLLVKEAEQNSRLKSRQKEKDGFLVSPSYIYIYIYIQSHGPITKLVMLPLCWVDSYVWLLSREDIIIN